ncbi:MAG: iron-containing alcohol dehydrogenase [Syntrophobacteraceae bacterium]
MNMPNFYQHYSPGRIIAGYDALKKLPSLMDRLGCKTAMVVTDKGVVAAGLIKHVEEAFEGASCSIAYVFDEAPTDSSNLASNKLARLFKEYHCDVFLAVGGGSALDTAKGANIVISQKSDDLLNIQGAENIEADLLPTIAVPTTAGTGSEVTKAAVIYNEEKKVKMLFSADKLYPTMAVLDPKMTATVPPKITAATGLDALTHSIEAFINLQKNPIEDAYAVAAIELINKYILRATQNGASDMEARFGMANAALMAGVAFSNSMVGIVHSLAHACGAVCHVPHGMANGILLPWSLEYNLPRVAEYIAQLSKPLGCEQSREEPLEQARVTIKLIRDLEQRLNEVCGVPLRLRDAGVAEEKLPLVARVAVNDGCLMYNPLEVPYEDALRVLRNAY